MCVCVHTRVSKWKVTDWLLWPRKFSMNDKEFSTRWNLKSHSESCCWPHRLALTTFRLWSSEGCLGVDTCNVSPVGIRLITNVCLPVSIPWGAMKENNWKQTYTVISNTCWSRTGQIPQILCLNVDLFYFSHLLFLSFLKKYNKYKWKVCDLKVIGALCFYWLLFIFFFFQTKYTKRYFNSTDKTRPNETWQHSKETLCCLPTVLEKRSMVLFKIQMLRVLLPFPSGVAIYIIFWNYPSWVFI